MARKVFFSFHFERDVWRVGQVRNSWLTKSDRESAGYWDKAKYEEINRQGPDAIQRWIDNSLHGTSVTVVLIGAETDTRDWVKYEIHRSEKRGNGMFGIHIHNIKDSLGLTDRRGGSNFGKLENGKYFLETYPIYDWVTDNGYQNLGQWVEKAALVAGK